MNIGWKNSVRQPDQPMHFAQEQDEDNQEPQPCARDQWASTLVPHSIRYIHAPQQQNQINTKTGGTSRSRRSPRKYNYQSFTDLMNGGNAGREGTSPRSIASLGGVGINGNTTTRFQGIQTHRITQPYKGIPLIKFDQEQTDKPQEEKEIDKFVDKMRASKEREDRRQQRIQEQKLRMQTPSRQQKAKRNKKILSNNLSGFSNQSLNEKEEDVVYDFTTDFRGNKIDFVPINMEKLKPVQVGSKLLRNQSDEAFLEKMKKMKRIQTTKNLIPVRKKPTIFDQYKDQVSSLIKQRYVTNTNNSNTTNMLMLSHIDTDKKYNKPFPPSQILDLQHGVKLKDRYMQKGGGEFTMTLRNQMSREEYFGSGHRSHRIIPPSLNSGHSKKRSTENVKFSEEDGQNDHRRSTGLLASTGSLQNHIGQPQTARVHTGDRKMHESLSTIFGDSNEMSMRKKLRSSMGEKILVNKRKDQIRDLLQYDKNNLWNANKLNIVLNPLHQEENNNNFFGISPKVNPSQLLSARNTQYTTNFDQGFQSTIDTNSIKTPRIQQQLPQDKVYFDTYQMQQRQDQLEKLRTQIITRQTTTQAIRPRNISKNHYIDKVQQGLEKSNTERVINTVKVRDRVKIKAHDF